MPGAPRGANPCRAAAAHPGTRAGGPAGERAPSSAAPARPESPLPAAAQLSSPRVGASNPCAPPPQPRVHRQAPSPISAPEGRGGKGGGAELPGWRVSPGGGASLAGAQESGWGHPCLERYQGPAAPTLPPPHRHPSVRPGLRRTGGLSCQPQGAESAAAPTRACPQLMFCSYRVPFSAECYAVSGVAPSQLEG